MQREGMDGLLSRRPPDVWDWGNAGCRTAALEARRWFEMVMEGLIIRILLLFYTPSVCSASPLRIALTCGYTSMLSISLSCSFFFFALIFLAFLFSVVFLFFLL